MRHSPIPAFFALLALLVASPLPSPAAVDWTQRTVSSSRQFTIYCSDSALRSRVANFADEVKGEVLRFLNESDPGLRAYPIVITIDRVPEGEDMSPANLQVFALEEGFKIQIDVRIGEDPAAVNLQRHIVRALLLEFAYRQRANAIEGGAAYTEAPWWLVEGMIQVMRRRDTGFDTTFFERMLEANRLPNLQQFLTTPPANYGRTSRAIDEGCAMCLVRLLTDQPNGQSNLARLLRLLPDYRGDAVALLTRAFPLLQAETDLQKWWTLNIARLSAADRHKGLSPEETDAQLATLLHFELPVDEKGTKRSFGIGEFGQFSKIPESRALMATLQSSVVALSAQANALYRPVVAEYEQIFGLLARGKTSGLKERITKVDAYREAVLRRTTDIADYLNWIEATQMATRSGKFDGYLQVANEMAEPTRRDDPVSRYLDEIAQEF